MQSQMSADAQGKLAGSAFACQLPDRGSILFLTTRGVGAWMPEGLFSSGGCLLLPPYHWERNL